MFHLNQMQRKSLSNSYFYLRLKYRNKHDRPYTILKTTKENFRKKSEFYTTDVTKMLHVNSINQEVSTSTNVSPRFLTFSSNLTRSILLVEPRQRCDLNLLDHGYKNCVESRNKHDAISLSYSNILPVDSLFKPKSRDTSYKAFSNRILALSDIEKGGNCFTVQTRHLHTAHVNAIRNANLVKDFDTENIIENPLKTANKGNFKGSNDFTIKADNDNSHKSNKTINNARFSELAKNTLHCFFSMLSQELASDFSVSPSYVKSHNDWHCTYYLKWPEQVKITKHGHNKKEASNKAAVAVLEWLKSHGKINSEGKPVIYDALTIKNMFREKNRKVLILEDTILNKLHLIHERYRNNFFKYLESDIENGMEKQTCADLANFETPWPLKEVKQKILDLEDYLVKEDIKLPIQEFKNDIIKLIDENRIVIIKGETGCGKSIRVPQYILEGWSRNGALDNKPCKIIVTQPRRIAAISLAERVAFERDEQVGNTIGYQVRFKTNFNNNTGRILYCTTGILLRRLQSDPSLSDCTHIILDEAHERDVNTDLLMNLLHYAMEVNSGLKLVIMSATINTDVFKEYFENSAVFHVPGITYPVKQHYIDSDKIINFEKTLNMCESIEPYVVIEDVVNTIKYIHRNKPEGAILCFLPSWEDISRVTKALPTLSSDMVVLRLHSKLDIAEQKKVFTKPPPGVRKVILSTNIAETSVTIDDIVYVVDTGMQKQTKFDAEKGIMCVDQEWISQANAQQRRGRAGRVQPGESFHLYKKKQMEKFTKYPMPEILRTSLTKIVLDSKVYSNNMNAIEFLSQLPTPPSENAIVQAVNHLRELDLLDENENLTPLGRTLSNFQMEPKLAKAIANAVIFRCVTPIIDIVTLFSEETNIFSSVLANRDDIKKVKSEFSETSDHLAMIKIFEKWLEYAENRDRYGGDTFCSRRNLITYKLHTLQKLRDVYFDYVYNGFNREALVSDEFSNNDEMIKGVLLSDAGSILKLSHLDKVKGRLKKKNVFLTRHNHKANISLESVNSKKNRFPSDFIVYINETRSNIRRTTTVRETSFISLLSLLLFKNEEVILKEIPTSEYSDQLDSKDQVILRLENAQIECICDKSHAKAIINCREALKAGIVHYTSQLTGISEGDTQIDQEWKEILNILCSILSLSKT